MSSSQGDTRDKAVANIREAIAACLEVRADLGRLGHAADDRDPSGGGRYLMAVHLSQSGWSMFYQPPDFCLRKVFLVVLPATV